MIENLPALQPEGAIITYSDFYGKNSGSARIRALSLLKYWPGCHRYATGKFYRDFLIFQKVNWPEMVEHYPALTVYDLCDPIWLERDNALECLAKCDAVVTATQALKDALKSFGIQQDIAVIDDHIDPEFGSPKEEHTGKLKKVVWFGFHHTNYLLIPFIPTLKRKGIELHVVSNLPFANADFSYHYQNETVCDIITSCDAVLLPEYEDADPTNPVLPFKSENKTYQAWAWGMPVIRTKDDIERFEDPNERQIEGLQRREEMLSTRHVESAVKQWRAFLGEQAQLSGKVFMLDEPS